MSNWKIDFNNEKFFNKLKDMKEQAEQIISSLKKEKEDLLRENKNGRMAEKQSS